MKLDNDDLATLEGLVDKSTISEVVELLSRICSEKADHSRSSYQDEALAKQWEKHAAVLDKVTVKLGG